MVGDAQRVRDPEQALAEAVTAEVGRDREQPDVAVVVHEPDVDGSSQATAGTFEEQEVAGAQERYHLVEVDAIAAVTPRRADQVGDRGCIGATRGANCRRSQITV